MKKPSELHKEGYNCAEAVIKAYNEKYGTSIPVSIGSGMGTGFTVGSVCGAVGAATAIIGYVKGREDNKEENKARGITKELMNSVVETYGSELCKDLKKNKISCAEIIEFTFEQLNKIEE